MFWKNREFAEAYGDYYPLVFSIVYTKVGNIEDAEDICQEVFIKFYEKLETIENRRKWLYGALRLQIFSHFRKKSRGSVELDEVADDVGFSFVNGFRDVRIILEEAFDETANFNDERERVLFDLIAIRHFTYEEAGRQLGWNKRQVRYRYGEIVKRVLDYLRKKGIDKLEDLL